MRRAVEPRAQIVLLMITAYAGGFAPQPTGARRAAPGGRYRDGLARAYAWLDEVGVPAKSGEAGNSVRGRKAITAFMEEPGADVFASTPGGRAAAGATR